MLGVTALEAFGLEVDVVRGTLREAELLMLSFASDRGRGRLTLLKQPATHRTDRARGRRVPSLDIRRDALYPF